MPARRRIRETFAMADLAIVPVFETQRMCARASRIFGTGTARDMYAWSHYSFMQRIYYKSQTTATDFDEPP
jgi:transposase